MMSYFLSSVAQILIGAVRGWGRHTQTHTSIMQNRTVGVKKKWIDEEFIWKAVNRNKEESRKLEGPGEF